MLIYAGGLSFVLDMLWFEKFRNVYVKDLSEASDSMAETRCGCRPARNRKRCEYCTSRHISRRHSGTAVRHGAFSALCRALGNAGVDVEVFTTTANGTEPLPAAPGGTAYDGVPVRYFRWPGPNGTGAERDCVRR